MPKAIFIRVSALSRLLLLSARGQPPTPSFEGQEACVRNRLFEAFGNGT